MPRVCAAARRRGQRGRRSVSFGINLRPAARHRPGRAEWIRVSELLPAEPYGTRVGMGGVLPAALEHFHLVNGCRRRPPFLATRWRSSTTADRRCPSCSTRQITVLGSRTQPRAVAPFRAGDPSRFGTWASAVPNPLSRRTIEGDAPSLQLCTSRLAGAGEMSQTVCSVSFLRVSIDCSVGYEE